MDPKPSEEDSNSDKKIKTLSKQKAALEIAKVYIQSELKEFENETWKQLSVLHWTIRIPIYSINVYVSEEEGKLTTLCGISEYWVFKEEYQAKVERILRNVTEIITGANKVSEMEAKDPVMLFLAKVADRVDLIEKELEKKVEMQEVHEAIKQSNTN